MWTSCWAISLRKRCCSNARNGNCSRSISVPVFLLSSWTIGFIPRMPLRIAYCVISRRKTSKVSEFTICPTPLSPRGLCFIIWILRSIRRFRTLHRCLVSRRSDMCDWINSRCGVSNCFLR